MPQASATSLVARATLLGVAVATVPCVAVWLSGAVPVENRSYLLLGLGAAIAAALLVALTQRGVVSTGAGDDARLTAARLQSWLGLAFGAKLLVLLLGVGGLWLTGLKFEGLATFALTFVGAALICQLAAAGYLARALNRAARVTKNQP